MNGEVDATFDRPSVGQGTTILSLLIVIFCGATAWIALSSGQRTQQAGLEDQEPIPGYATPPQIREWREIEDFEQPLAQFETVFWEPADTTSLRAMLRETDLVKQKAVLEIGTGTGLIALCSAKAEASRVVATDINPSAIACARFNAERLGLDSLVEFRLVDLDRPQAFAVIGDDEKFDLIISNPPWEDAQPESIGEFALYDESFLLLKSIMTGGPEHLKPGGRLLLAYGCVTAIREILKLAKDNRYDVIVHDERNLDELPEVFLPGMLIELIPERANE